MDGDAPDGGEGGGGILSAEHVVFYSWTLVTQASSWLTEIAVEYWQILLTLTS